MPSRPFVRGRFEDLPDEPHRPHAFASMRARELSLDVPHLGRCRLHLRELGAADAPPLLLVHGLMTTSYSFRYVVAPLAERYRVLVPDLPGAGRSEVPRLPLSARGVSASLPALLDALGLSAVDTIGNSMGGYLVLRAALERPDAFGRVVDVHSPGVPEARLWALRTALRVPGARRLLTSLVHASPERWVHRNVHYRDETLKSREEAREYGAPLASAAGALAFASYLGEVLDPLEMKRFGDRLRSLTERGEPFPRPVLLLYSTEDPMVPPAVGPALAALLGGSKLEWVPDTSHFMHVDTPEAFLERALRFLEG
jgi:pimeloyl-ACP methyl ester carboxylesterase